MTVRPNAAQLASMDQADALCAAEPLQYNIREELFRIEEWATSRGINAESPYRLFMLAAQPNGAVVSMPMDIMTKMWIQVVPNVGGDPMAALEFLSMAATDPDQFGKEVPDVVRQAFHQMLHEYAIGGDWKFHALGVCLPGLALRDDAPNAGHIIDLDDVDAVANHPDTRPAWYSYLLCVDSRIWTVMHLDGHDRVHATAGPDDTGLNFPALNGLTRLVTAITDV